MLLDFQSSSFFMSSRVGFKFPKNFMQLKNYDKAFLFFLTSTLCCDIESLNALFAWEENSLCPSFKSVMFYLSLFECWCLVNFPYKWLKSVTPYLIHTGFPPNYVNAKQNQMFFSSQPQIQLNFSYILLWKWCVNVFFLILLCRINKNGIGLPFSLMIDFSLNVNWKNLKFSK